MREFWVLGLLRKVHNDEEGTVSLETILILGAIAVPVLLVMIKFGWPAIRRYFDKGVQDLQDNSDRAVQQ
jgi:hypothetical protein